MTLSAVQTAVTAAVAQVAALAVAFGLFSNDQAQIMVSAAGSVIAAVVAVIYAVEQWKAVKVAEQAAHVAHRDPQTGRYT